MKDQIRKQSNGIFFFSPAFLTFKSKNMTTDQWCENIHSSVLTTQISLHYSVMGRTACDKQYLLEKQDE
jgi:hypothetical protein